MRIKLICCDVFARWAYKTAAESPNIVDIELLPMLAHNEPEKLRIDLQDTINKAGKVNKPGTDDCIYDRIILAYGLCGNAIAGLTCTVPMIIPRMHDCCAMFMGSQERFLEVFGQNLSSSWRSFGYLERCLNSTDLNSIDSNGTKTHPDYLKLLDEYGKEDADYVWDTLHPPPSDNKENKVFYIQMEYEDVEKSFSDFDHSNPPLHYNHYLNYIEQKKQEGCIVETVKGSTTWFTTLINGPWDNKNFLELLPGHTIKPIYDMKEIFQGTIP